MESYAAYCLRAESSTYPTLPLRINTGSHVAQYYEHFCQELSSFVTNPANQVEWNEELFRFKMVDGDLASLEIHITERFQLLNDDGADIIFPDSAVPLQMYNPDLHLIEDEVFFDGRIITKLHVFRHYLNILDWNDHMTSEFVIKLFTEEDGDLVPIPELAVSDFFDDSDSAASTFSNRSL